MATNPPCGQDWNNVVFKKRMPNNETLQQIAQQKHSNNNDEKMEQPKQKVSVAQKQTLAQLRMLAGYTSQKLLAAASRGKLTVSRINELENGKGNVPSGAEKQILFKLVKIKY